MSCCGSSLSSTFLIWKMQTRPAASGRVSGFSFCKFHSRRKGGGICGCILRPGLRIDAFLMKGSAESGDRTSSLYGGGSSYAHKIVALRQAFEVRTPAIRGYACRIPKGNGKGGRKLCLPQPAALHTIRLGNKFLFRRLSRSWIFRLDRSASTFMYIAEDIVT